MNTSNDIFAQIQREAQAADKLRARASEMLVSAVRAGYAAGLSQRQIAEAVGRSQPEVSRLLRFHGTTPLGRRLRRYRPQVLDILRKAGVTNPRVFGSVARGEDSEDSDIDLLVDLPEGFGLLSLTRLEGKVAAVLDSPVDIVPASALRVNVSESALSDAVPL
jgi:predicted nucleotidyltransferase/predicted XRE-type DNA-binding protein